MNRAFLRQVPRLTAAASRSSFTPRNLSPALARNFASAPPDTSEHAALPKAPLPSENLSNSTAFPSQATEQLHSTDAGLGATPDLITTSTDAIAVEPVLDGTDVAVEVATSWSDTLLQPTLSLLNLLHDTTGLPWWMTIGVSTIAIRSMLLPVTLMTMKNSARMQALQGEIGERREAVMEAMRTGNRPASAQKQVEMQQFMRDAGVTPLKMLVGPLVQFPVFISLFVGIRRLSQSNPDFVTGGTAWFTNLAVMDPTFVLPVMSGMSLMAMTELGGDTGTTQLTPQMKMAMRAIAVISVPLTYWFPAAVFCYWLPNNCFSVLLGVAMRQPTMRQALGLKVDVATIPGTKAYKELAAKLAAQGVRVSKGHVDAAAAVATYTGAVTANAGQMIGKPILLKHKPRGKKNVAR